MTLPTFLDAITELDGAVPGPRRFSATIDEDWGIVFSQGGVVFALMVRATEQVLDRPDLRAVSTNATFLRPVRCGPVTLEVTVLRSGRSGAQVQISLHDDADPDPSPNVMAMLVAAAEDPDFPAYDGLVSPFDASVPHPLECERIGVDEEGHPTMPFFARTDWRGATPPPVESRLQRLAWFSFGEDSGDEPWDDALLAIPGDALGLAAGTVVAERVGLLTAPSLELTLHFHTPARGRWLGIDTRCHRTAGGVTWGVATLWNEDGSLVATATQTALMRRLSTA